jgi:hypothetical protein
MIPDYKTQCRNFDQSGNPEIDEDGIHRLEPDLLKRQDKSGDGAETTRQSDGAVLRYKPETYAMYSNINELTASSGAINFDALNPRGMIRASLDVMRLSAEALRLLLPGQVSRVVWQEFKNKLQAFDLFENVDSVLGLSAGTAVPLTKLVEKTRALEAYRAVWATEGLGHYHTELCWDRTGPPKDLLRNSNADDLPLKSLTALHAGMGLSLSNRLLKTIRSPDSESEVRGVLKRLLDLCRQNSRSGHVGVAYEALGLVTRNLYPHLVQVVDRQLKEIDEKLVGYFWHGVGRAIYFAPTNFLPFNNSPWRAVEMTQREPPNEIGRLNALAGLVWAMTLVNTRQPEILETLLRHHGNKLSQNDALSNGVSSAIMIWRDSTGDDSCLAALCQHRPEPSDPDFNELWTEQVLHAGRNALHRFYPVIKEHDCLGEVFQYQSLAELVGRMERN